jgi:leucyl-tRNA synthetase
VVFDRALPFSELEALQAVVPYIKTSLKYNECDIITADEARAKAGDEISLEKAEASEPGTPAAQFWNE